MKTITIETKKIAAIALYLISLDESLDGRAWENNIEIDKLLKILNVPTNLDWYERADFLRKI